MVLNTTFNYITVDIVAVGLLVEEIGVPKENYQPTASY